MAAPNLAGPARAFLTRLKANLPDCNVEFCGEGDPRASIAEKAERNPAGGGVAGYVVLYPDAGTANNPGNGGSDMPSQALKLSSRWAVVCAVPFAQGAAEGSGVGGLDALESLGALEGRIFHFMHGWSKPSVAAWTRFEGYGDYGDGPGFKDRTLHFTIAYPVESGDNREYS